ncbi:MAG: hypothetical protein ACKPGF_26505, partial [Microcystis panniformis]
FKFKDKQIYLAKCTEPLPIRWSRQIPESCEPSTVTVRLHPSGRWHISIRFDDPTIKPLPVTDKAIGIDLGISSLVITSDGDKVSNPKYFKRLYRLGVMAYSLGLEMLVKYGNVQKDVI